MIRNFRRVRCSLPSIHPHPDATAVRNRLTAADRQVGDLTAAHLADFWGCGAGEDLAGVVGLEGYGPVALLRSLAVAPPALQQNAEFAALCPARAECMTQVLVEQR